MEAVEALKRKREYNIQEKQVEKVIRGLDPKNDTKVLQWLAEPEQPRKKWRSVLYDGHEENSEDVGSRPAKEEMDSMKYSPWTMSRQQSIVSFFQTRVFTKSVYI